MNINNLSICIVGKDKAPFVKQCIESCFKLTDQISYVDLGSKDSSTRVAETYGIYVSNGNFYQEVPETLRNFHKSPWILFLRPDEEILFGSTADLIQHLNNEQAMGYSLIVKNPVTPKTLEDYRWIKIPGKQNRYSPESLIVSKIEVRLVRSQFFDKALNLMISFAPEKIYAFDSNIIKDVRIHCLQQPGQKETDLTNTKDLEMKFLRGEISLDAEEDYGMWELGDRFIGYNVLMKDDFARYQRGLAMGFGSEQMYVTLLNKYIKYGRFNKAREFFDAWLEKWRGFATPEPYKAGGIIYAHLFQLEKAVSFFHKHLELVSGEQEGEAHLLLGKMLLLLGKKDQAVECFKQAALLGNEDLDSTLIRTIENKNWKPPRLSLCMIAKDEQANIFNALNSVSGAVDEIIVVDTGSVDGTKEIAAKFNAKVIDFDWEDDFSKARNAGLQSATGDYILCLDADEYLDPRDRLNLALLKMTLPSAQSVAFRVKIETEDEDEEMSALLNRPKMNEDYSIRLMPARETIRFKGPVFETVDQSVQDLGIEVATNTAFKITHSGADRKYRETRKEAAVQKMYDVNLEPETALKAALYHLKIDNTDAALKWFELAPCEHPRLWMKIITLYCRIGRAKAVAGMIEKASAAFPDFLGFHLAKAELDFSEGEFEAVCETLAPDMEKIGKEMNREDRATAAYLYGMALLETDRLAQGIELLSDARELDIWNTRFKLGGIYALTLADQWENAIGALSETLTEEGLLIEDTINSFADLGIVFKTLGRHYEINDRMEASDLCEKITLNIIENKISDPNDLKKIIHYLDTHTIGKEQPESGSRNI